MYAVPDAQRAEVEDLDDAGVADRGRRARLVEEALRELGVVGQARAQDLDRGAPPDPRVLGEVDDAHAAFTDELGDPVVAEGLADH